MKNHSLLFKEEYESLNGVVRPKDGRVMRAMDLPAHTPVTLLTDREAVDLLEQGGSGLVYFGFPDCPWCRSLVPTLARTACKLNKGFYYLNVAPCRSQLELGPDRQVVVRQPGTPAYYRLLELLAPLLEEFCLRDPDKAPVPTGEKRIYAPSLVPVRKGVPVRLTSALSRAQTDGYQPLTPQMEQEMAAALAQLFLEL